MMRCMGRWESDSSPMRREVKGCPARNPDSMRMVEPELPASRSALGADQSRPRPSMVTSRPSMETRAPRASTQRRVEWQSAPEE